MPLKLVFKRARPWYRTKRSTYVLPGEEFSFPSGHCIRAATLAFWFTKDADAPSSLWSGSAGAGISSGALLSQSTELFLLIWIALVMVCRVGLGKHYPLDVAAGTAIGIMNGCFLSYAPLTVSYSAK